MIYRVQKFVSHSANLVLLWLTYKFFTYQLDWGMVVGALLLSGFWLAFTGLRLRRLFASYADIFSRLSVRLPLLTGLFLSGLACFVTSDLTLRLVAVAEIVAWGIVYILYRRNQAEFVRQGHGPLPKDAWVNVDWQYLRPGDLLLFSGDMAGRLHESVGHGEVVLQKPDGQMVALSSYMEKGALFNDLAAVTRARMRRGHYVVMRLKQGLSAADNAKAVQIAEEMLRQNAAWRDRVNARRSALIKRLPLPGGAKAFLLRKFHASGYDWPGLLIGTRASNRWTCIGACLELYHRMGIRTNHYGTGLLGLGTGLLNPIMPVRFLTDPAFELITIHDKSEWDAQKSGQA